jgi:5-methylcytosine-specific restriction endonuclease McrA
MIIYRCKWCDGIFWDKNRKYCSDKCRKLARESKKKAKSYLTRGGHTIYEYRKFKKEILKERGCICQKCKIKANLVHHIKPVSKYPELELVKSNVIVICIDCHIKCHPELLAKFMKNSVYIIGK